jgi:bacterioferritin-associated ferredoxin
MIVCHCQVVSDRTVAASIADGARTLAEVCRATGAGQTCGSCVFSLKRLICQHEVSAPSSVPEVHRAAS